MLVNREPSRDSFPPRLPYYFKGSELEKGPDRSVRAAPAMRVRVCVRVRPLLPQQTARGDKSTLLRVEPSCVHLAQNKGGRASYAVDAAAAAAFGDESAQEAFYQQCEIDRLVDAVTRGFHATVFAYGQTGSGKTFTMEGFEYLPAANGKAPQVDIAGTPRSRLGIVPRAVRKLFAAVEAENSKGGSRMRVMCSYVQIYKEQVWQRWPVRLSLETKGLLFKASVAHRWRPRLFGSQHEQ